MTTRRDDSHPLLSRAMVLVLVSASVGPTLGGIWWLSAKLSGLETDTTVIKGSLQQLRTEMYPRSEANLQWQHGAQQLDELKSRMAAMEARTQTRREDFQRADQPEARRAR